MCCGKTNGTAVTNAVLLNNPGASWTGVVAGVDLNGDGLTDLIEQNANSTLVGATTNGAGSIIGVAQLAAARHRVERHWQQPDAIHRRDRRQRQFGPARRGADQFDLTSYTAGVHSIAGFDPALDSVALSASLFPSYAALQASEAPYEGGTLIALGANAVEVIQGVAPSQLSANNFVFR